MTKKRYNNKRPSLGATGLIWVLQIQLCKCVTGHRREGGDVVHRTQQTYIYIYIYIYIVCSFQYSGVLGTFLLVFPDVFSLFAACVFLLDFVWFLLFLLFFVFFAIFS